MLEFKEGVKELLSLLKETMKFHLVRKPRYQSMQRKHQNSYARLSEGEKWKYFYDVLTDEDVKNIDKGEMTTEQIQNLIRERKKNTIVSLL